MRISVLSGKGGTGKTFLAVNLAYAAKQAVYVDCDVEEPNGRIFLKSNVRIAEKQAVTFPKVDTAKCRGCKTCVDFCKFNALAYIKDKLLIFPELCHGCGGCVMLCPHNALTEAKRNIGIVEFGKCEHVSTRTGLLNTGEATGVPIIKRLLEGIPLDTPAIIDCPPGSSCAVMESIKDSDFCVLVTEPTLFGVHNLSMVFELVTLFKKPYGVVINKTVEGERIADEYCLQQKMPVLAQIPYSNDLGRIMAKGQIVAEQAKYRSLFTRLLQKIRREIPHEATGCPER